LVASSPAALISNTITFTATVSPSTSSGSVLFSVVSGGAAATFVGGGITVNPTISNGQATAVLQSTLVGTYTVRATYGTANSSDVSVKFADSTYPVMLLTASTSYLLTAHDPLDIVASFYPELTSGDVNMSVSGGGAVISANGITYGTSATASIINSPSNKYHQKAYVFLKSSDGITTGNATVTATFSPYPTASTIVTMLPEIGTSTKSVWLTANGIAKIGGNNVLDLVFQIVNNAPTNAACYYKETNSTLPMTLSSGQSQSTVHLISFYQISPGTPLGNVPVKLVDVVYGYNPVMPDLSIVPVSMHVYDGTSSVTVTLDAADFLIQ